MQDVPRLGSLIPLVARGREMSRLRAAFDQADAGTAVAVLLSGDAGVGKTRLTEELAAAAADRGAVVLTGRCLDAGEASLPYLPFTEALAQLGDREQAVTAHPALARLFPDSVSPVAGAGTAPLLPEMGVADADARPRGRPEQDIGQLQLFDAVLGLLTDLAERTAVVLVLEDLHWADGATRRLLSFLVSRLRTQRLLILGSYRGDDLHRRHPLRQLLAELVRLPAVERWELAPFDSADSRAFVAELAEELLTDDLVREVADRSEGNAFFAEELLAAYTDGARGIPATLVDVLLSRVEQLSDPAQQIVRVASVAGRRAPHATLHAVSGLAEPVLENALREAVQHHVLVARATDRDGDVYVFRHALLREAVYGDLLPGERVRLHGAYAQWLVDQQGKRGAAASLAYHSMESHALPQALAASVAAAKEADESGAPTESLHHLERALKLWNVVPEADRPVITGLFGKRPDSPVDELMLLRGASWAAGAAGEPERAVAFARSAMKVADERGDPELAADVRRRLAHALFVLEGREDEAREVIEHAWELVSDRSASCERAWVLAVHATILRGMGERDRARVFAEHAIRDARAVSAAGAEADALITLAALAEARGQVEESQTRLTDALRLAKEATSLVVELRARHYLAVNRYESGRLTEAVTVIDEGVARARDTGMTWGTFGVDMRVLQVLCRYACGDWDGGEAAAEPPGTRVSNTVSARLAAAGTHVAVGRGRFAEAGRLVEELRSEWHRDYQIGAIMGPVAAELAGWQGDPRRGVAAVNDTLDWAERVGGKWMLVGVRLGALGASLSADLVHQLTRDREERPRRDAVAEGERLAAHAEDTARHGRPRSDTLGPEGRAWLARAAAERSRLYGAGDPRLWRVAVDAFGYGAVYEQALCRWRLAEALLGPRSSGASGSASPREEATEQLRAAAGVARRLGAEPLDAAVRQLARRARIVLEESVPAADAAAVRDPFTPRERSVLRLVALGRTNREVGAELYISEKTVSVHLSRIMAKLGATRRAEAVAIAYDRGLLRPDGADSAG